MTNYDLISKLAGSHYLEIGVQEGGSMEAALRTGRVTLAVGVDTWGVEYGGTGRKTPDHVIKRLSEFRHHIMLLTGDSKSVIPMITHLFNLIFIDGDHSREGCLVDLEHCLRLCAPGGIILLDDIDNPSHPSLQEPVMTFCKQRGLHVTMHDAHLGVAQINL